MKNSDLALNKLRRAALSSSFLGVVLALSAASSCGEGSPDGDSNLSTGGTGGDAGPNGCDPNVSKTCNQECSEDSECDSGTYCKAGRCGADCTPGTTCSTGAICTSQGRCGPLISTDGGDAKADSCADVEVDLEKQTPTVMLLIDQSASMDQMFGGVRRWNGVRDSLMDPTDGIVANLETDVRFGLALYSSENGNDGDAGACPLLAKVSIALDNYDAINQEYSDHDVIDDTPTGESIDAVVADLEDFTEPGEKIIVLATDGEPDSCDVPDPQTPEARELSITAAQNAFDKGIKTFIISVGSEIGDQHLRDMANAGQGLPLDTADPAPFYRTNNQEELTEAFQEIINGVRSCVFELDGDVKSDSAAEGTVTLDGEELDYENDENGWRLIDNDTKVELLGAACDSIKTGDHDLRATFPCDSVIR